MAMLNWEDFVTEDGLFKPVRAGALAPISGRYLLRVREGGGQLQKRQELPDEAFRLHPNKTRAVALSYRWLTPGHPDPDGFHLAIVCQVVQKFLTMLRDGYDVGLFWDFGSLYQNPRDPKQHDLFMQGLKASNIWYASTESRVWIQPHLPSTFIGGPYSDSGWCFCEASISSSIKPSDFRLNLGEVKIEHLAKSGDYYDLVMKCMKNRLPPLSPNAFEQKLRTEKAFTNGKEDFDRVVNIYNTFFGVVSGSATKLQFASVGWSADHLRDFAEALPLFTNLKVLNLHDNHFGDGGARVLAGALKANQTITELDLCGNHIGSDGAVALAEALKANQTITFLQLSANNIGNHGAVALAEALKTNDTIKHLDLRFNDITDDGAVALANAVMANQTITELRLSDNEIGSDGAVALANALKARNGKLSVGFGGGKLNVDLYDNPGNRAFKRAIESGPADVPAERNRPADERTGPADEPEPAPAERNRPADEHTGPADEPEPAPAERNRPADEHTGPADEPEPVPAERNRPADEHTGQGGCCCIVS